MTKITTLKISKAKAEKEGKLVHGYFVNISFSNPLKGFYFFDKKVVATCGMDKDPAKEVINKALELIEKENFELNLNIEL